MRYFLLYDLETSSKDCIGQILTACFLLVDENFQIVPEMDLEISISISRLELPHPDAILTNRIDVLKHQKISISEFEACQEIMDFFSVVLKYIGEYRKLKFLGYNSSKFDLLFLRTTLIRNGFNPYFQGNLLYGDGLHLIRKLAWKEKNFPLKVEKKESYSYYSYSLENMCRIFGLLEGKQPHSAKEDVILLAKLLYTIQNTFSLNLWDEEEFEKPNRFFIAQTKPKPGGGKELILFENKEFYLLDQNKNSCLFVDIGDFKEGKKREAIRYKNKTTGYLYIEKSLVYTPERQELEKMIRQEFQNVNCNNFFLPSDCDIEQDIYRLSFVGLDSLREKISGKISQENNSQDLKQLWRRYVLKNTEPGKNEISTHHFEKAFKQYVSMRYIKGVKLNKFGEKTDLSPTWKELFDLSQDRLQYAEGDDKNLLQSLDNFYENSEIKQIIDQIA